MSESNAVKVLRAMRRLNASRPNALSDIPHFSLLYAVFSQETSFWYSNEPTSDGSYYSSDIQISIKQPSGGHTGLLDDACLFLEVLDGETVIRKTELVESKSESYCCWRLVEAMEIISTFKLSLVLDHPGDEPQHIGLIQFPTDWAKAHCSEQPKATEFCQNFISSHNSYPFEFTAHITEIPKDIFPFVSHSDQDADVEQAFISEVLQHSDAMPSVAEILNLFGNFKLHRVLPADGTKKSAIVEEIGNDILAIGKNSDIFKYTPDHPQSHVDLLSKLGQCLLSRIRDHGRLGDISNAILCFEECVSLTSETDPAKLDFISDLATLLAQRWEHNANLEDINRAIFLEEEAVKIIPGGHIQKPSYLNSLGSSLSFRFQLKGEVGDIDKAISLQEDAVRLTAEDHTSKPNYLDSLGNSLLARFDHTGKLNDVDRAILHLEDALRLTSGGQPGLTRSLISLGNSLLSRFEHTGDIGDINRAILLQEEALKLTSDEHADKPGYLSNLGNSFLSRFEQAGNLSDVDKAISLQEEALKFISDKHVDKPGYLGNLGSSLLCRYQYTGKLDDIKNAVLKQEYALSLISEGHPDKLSHLTNLGSSLLHLFRYTGDLNDIRKSISLQEDAVKLTLEDHTKKPGRLNKLGSSLLLQFEHTGNISDIDRAITLREDALRLTPKSHTDRLGYQSNLGNSLSKRFKITGNLDDLNRAILLQTEAVKHTADTNYDKPSKLDNLGGSFFLRFEHSGDQNDLKRAISHQEDALKLTPPGHAERLIYLNNVGMLFSSWYGHTGEHAHIDKAISHQEAAVMGTPEGHSDKPGYLNNLGNSYVHRFEHTGDLIDLAKAIKFQQDAVQLTPEGHSDKPSHQINLGNLFVHQFRYTGDLRDIDKAILLQENAVRLTLKSHKDMPTHLTNLGYSILLRYEHTRNLGDARRAISLQEEAVKLTPDEPKYLRKLAFSFGCMFRHTGDLSNINQAILLQDKALGLIPKGHSDRATYSSDLGASLLSQFEHTKNIYDIEKAISLQEEAVRLTQEGHPDKAGCLSNLGGSYFHWSEHTGDISDINKAIKYLQDAVRLTPESHCDKPHQLKNLGLSFALRFHKTSQSSDFQQAVQCFKTATRSSTSDSGTRFSAALQWARFVYCTNGALASLEAYTVALEFMPLVAWLGQTVSERHVILASIEKIANESAAAAIISDKFGLALEWLEQGRSIVWQQLLNLRSPVDELHEKHPDLANELIQVSKALELASIKDHTVQNIVTQKKIGEHLIMEIAAQRHHHLAKKWETLIKRIRSLGKFEGFLKPKRLSQLLQAASYGPVVTINMHAIRCDALVILPDLDEVIHIPLDQLSYEKAFKLQNFLSKAMIYRNLRERGGRPVEAVSKGGAFQYILAELWTSVVKPILDSLAFSVSELADPPRVWWCPTGPLSFLPIHAAGLYNQLQDSVDVSSFVCSSYTPSLTALLNGLVAQNTSHTYKGILAISQRNAPRKSVLHNAEIEVEQVLKHAQNHGGQAALHLTGPAASVEQVLSNIEKFSWIHFACHAEQATGTPTDSAFCLHNGQLKLSKIISMSNKDAEFAFLSACQTATGDKKLSNEAVHLAAGMQFAGYRSVIATMWSIGDDDAPIVADRVYTHLFRGAEPNSMEAAHALHRAVKELRKKVGDLEFMSWVPFIHVGI